MSDQPGAGLPQNVEPIGNLVPEVGGHGLPPSLQILLNEGLFNRIKQLATYMANGRGITPAHLLDKPEACFAIINMSLDWKLTAQFVARHTYQTPGGAIGFDGALVHAVLEKSGRFIGAPQMEYRGDWNSLVGKFELKTGGRGGTYPVPTWTSKDAIGLGVIVRWRVKGEPEPRVWPGENNPFWLHQCFPLNSPLWATDPKTQIAYLAIRRFANLTSPGILGAAAFDQDELIDASERAIDVTEPRREPFNASRPAEPVDQRPEFAVVDNDGVEYPYRTTGRAIEAIATVLREAARQDLARLDGAWENNQATIEALAIEDTEGIAGLGNEYEAMRNDLTSPRVPRTAAAEPPGADANRTGAAPVGDAPARGGPATEAQQGSPPASETMPPVNQPSDGEPAAPATAAATAPPPEGFSKGPGDAPPEREPPARPSRAIAPPLRLGQPDYRVWAIALMGPKVRQQRTSDDLAMLLGDNNEHLAAAERALVGQHAGVYGELEETIKQQWTKIG